MEHLWEVDGATGETVLYSGMDEGEIHERGVGLILPPYYFISLAGFLSIDCNSRFNALGSSPANVSGIQPKYFGTQKKYFPGSDLFPHFHGRRSRGRDVWQALQLNPVIFGT